MKRIRLQKSAAVKLIAFSLIMHALISGCHTVPESVKSIQLTKMSVANARTGNTDGTCDYNYSAAFELQLKSEGWSKTFEDNFDVSPTNSANPNWNVWVGGAFNNELQMFTASPANLTVTQDPTNSANSLLVIKAIKEPVTGPKYRQDVDATPTNFDFTSARIESKTMFSPNRSKSQVRMVSRIKLSSGYGMWPAFWLYGDIWPTNGEIDILEARGNEPYVIQTNYFYGRKANENLVQNEGSYITTASNLIECWHVYEVIWTSSSLTFILDGVVFDVKSGSYVPNLYGKLERITLNQAVGGDFFRNIFGYNPTADQIPLNPGEGVMQVDWVKVFVKR